jgi:hypothetical protein
VTARGLLLGAVEDIRGRVAGLNLEKTIPVGVSDAGSAVTPQLLEGVDYFMANDHP